MGGYGWHNGYPFRYGGGTTPTEDIYRALRSTLGDEDARIVGPQGGIEDEWRRAKARVLAAGRARVESAILQAFPEYATEHLESWEQRLGVERESSEEARRSAVEARYVEEARSDVPHMVARLAEMSPFLSLYRATRDESVDVMFGLSLDPTNTHGAMFPGVATQWAAYSDHLVVRVIWDHEAAGVPYPPAPLLERLRRYLNEVLPSHLDWTIQQAPRLPFYLDGGPDGSSLLDARTVGPLP